MECIIDNITRMGIVAYLNYNDCKSVEDSPILFIIPKDFLEGNIESFSKGTTIRVKVLDTRVKFMANQIQVIGELSSSSN